MGIAAGFLALSISFSFRVYLGAIFLPELAAQTLFSIAPGEFESFAVQTLGPLAKTLAAVGSTVVQLLIYGGLAVFFGIITATSSTGSRYVKRAALLWFITYILVFGIGMILTFTTEISTATLSITGLALQLLPPQLLFVSTLAVTRIGITTHAEPAREVQPALETTDQAKRLAIRALILGGVATALIIAGLDSLRQPSTPSPPSPTPPSPSTRTAAEMLAVLAATEVTPNQKFYRIDVNLVTPTVEASTWNLTVGGEVENPLNLTLQDLQAMETAEQYSTLECVSNTIGGDLVSNALWRGIRLRTLLERAKITSNARFIVFRCSDGYDVGIPLERGLQEGTLLAHQMNGVTLPQDHGFPLRAIIPGIYGMMNAKWIREIEVTDQVHEGLWQRRGWSNTAEYNTHAWFATPGSALKERLGDLKQPTPIAGQKTVLAGVAFAGDRQVSKVEVSSDGGSTWSEATLKDPTSNHTWRLWAFEWTPPAPGDYRMLVRATDAKGGVQTSNVRDAFPDGATGYHLLTVRVS